MFWSAQRVALEEARNNRVVEMHAGAQVTGRLVHVESPAGDNVLDAMPALAAANAA